MSKSPTPSLEQNTQPFQKGNKGKQKATTQESFTTAPTTDTLFNPQMDLDVSLTSTEDPGIQEIIFHHKNNKLHQSEANNLFLKQTTTHGPKLRKSPLGFGSDTEDKSQTNLSDHGQEDTQVLHKRNPRTAFKPSTDWQVEYGRKRYKMVIEANKLPGENDTLKIHSIGLALARLESLTSTKLISQKGTKLIVAIFGTQKDADKAKNLTLADNSTIYMREVQLYNAIEAKHKTIRVWDIPLNVKQNEIREAFSKYGEINNISMTTTGMWQSANIEFTNQNEYMEICHRWAIPFKGDLVRIFPFIHTNECKNDRDRFLLKLINLPPNTAGIDLNTIIKYSKAQTCHIPRNRNYTRKRFAILSFKTQEDLDYASKTTHSLGNTDLTWVPMDTKICPIYS